RTGILRDHERHPTRGLERRKVCCVPTVRIVGPGRAGSSLADALASAGWAVADAVVRGDDPAGAAEGVDLCVVAVPDGAIPAVAGAIRPVTTTVVAHLAGSLGAGVLAPHARRAAMHPLVSLPDRSTGARALGSGCWWAVEGDSLAERVVADLGGRTVAVGPSTRAVYHAAACIAANHLVAVLGQLDRVVEAAGLPREPFYELAAGALANARAHGAVAAITGPAARGDVATIGRHLDALDDGERDLYLALAGAAALLAGRPAEELACR
ncbi:MAG TPA: DUF2520 domain-containing protein, partial [Acidimicrobiales bacterium]